MNHSEIKEEHPESHSSAPVSVVLKRRVRPEDAVSSWGSDHLFFCRRRTRVLALERDGVPHVHGELAGVEQAFYNAHTHTEIDPLQCKTLPQLV